MQELTQTKHSISKYMAGVMLKRYKCFWKKLLETKRAGGGVFGNIPNLPICLTYNKSAIYQLMKLAGCVSIRIYFAINEKQQLSLVMVGVDEAGDNIVVDNTNGSGKVADALAGENVGILDEGQASPPYPRPGDGLWGVRASVERKLVLNVTYMLQVSIFYWSAFFEACQAVPNIHFDDDRFIPVD